MGIPPGMSEPIAFDPGGNMPGPPAAPLRHGEATSASGDSKVLQICQANLREGWLKWAG
ncbi:hypothetical protein AMJ97_CH02334 [Rhizobium sp. N1314]|nr:hypothetical protein AMK02_CH02336 [Rhizobium sp. N731]ANL16160.1 hypothetical protein AMJ97_CH02334 [Rhizobium sp. N1314]